MARSLSITFPVLHLKLSIFLGKAVRFLYASYQLISLPVDLG